MYRERVNQHLVRCIVQLTVASQDDSLWRSINYQICLKTRSSEPQVGILVDMEGIVFTHSEEKKLPN